MSCRKCGGQLRAGLAFYCLECEDYQLCQQCEALNDHPHCMLCSRFELGRALAKGLMEDYKQLLRRLQQPVPAYQYISPYDLQRLGQGQAPGTAQVADQEQKLALLQFLNSGSTEESRREFLRLYGHLPLVQFSEIASGVFKALGGRA